jgi:hypothetical protein
MKKKTQQKRAKPVKPQRRGPARRTAARSGQEADAPKGVDDVQIADIRKHEPYPGYVYYTLRVRAKITLPSQDCYLNTCEADVYQTRSRPKQRASMYPEIGNEPWYTTDELMIYFQPGDTIYASVTAEWICPGSDSKDSAPVVLT